MLYETVGQSGIFFSMAFVGLNAGAFFDARSFLTALCFHKKIIGTVLDFVFTVCALVLFYLGMLKLNYGEFRLYLLIGYLLGFCAQRFILSKLLAKLFNFCYTWFKEWLNKIKERVGEKIKRRNVGSGE